MVYFAGREVLIIGLVVEFLNDANDFDEELLELVEDEEVV